jgi:hypothetical protein
VNEWFPQRHIKSQLAGDVAIDGMIGIFVSRSGLECRKMAVEK